MVESAPPHIHCGYLGYAGTRGIDTFVAKASFFDVIHPDWYSLDPDGVHVTPYRGVNDSRVLSTAKAAGIRVIPMVASVDDVTRTETMLDSASLRAAHIQVLVTLAIENGYDGLDLDYEHLEPNYRTELTTFYSELADAFHAKGLEASATVVGDFDDVSPDDYAAIATKLDHLHVMMYDFHWAKSHAGPLAPLGWTKAVAEHAAATGHGGKFIFTLGNYAYLPDGFCTTTDCLAMCTGNFQTTTTELTTCPFNTPMNFNPGRQPNCSVAGGTMWYEDTASFEEKVAAAKAAGLGGIGYWTLGGEPDGFFDAIGKYY